MNWTEGMPVLLAGIDPSAKKIAIVAAHPLLQVHHVRSYVLYKSTERQSPETLAKALDAMARFVEWADTVAPNGDRLAWVEDPVVGRGGVTATIKQAYVGGVIRASLSEANFGVYGVNVSTWKAQVCGNGHASKADVRRVVNTLWPKVAGLAGDDGDLIDAAAIAIYGAGVLAKAQRVRDAGPAGGAVHGGGP